MSEQRSFVDLHSHSSASFDSLSDPASMVRRARQLGLTHLAITDHERIDGALRARDLGDADVQVIVGEEIRSREGDMIGLFMEEAVPPGLDAAETAAAIHEQDGLVGLPHPFDSFRSSGVHRAREAEAMLERLASMVDYVETYNARAYRDANPLAGAFARRHELPGLASSDAHSVMEIGIASTILPAAFSTSAGLKELLPRATLMMGRASYYVRLWTPLAKIVQRARGNGRVRKEHTSGSHGNGA